MRTQLPPPPQYIDRISQQGISVDIGLAPVAGGANVRRQNVARVRVHEGYARGWRVVLAPIVFNEPFAGAILDFTSGDPNKPAAIVTFGADGTYTEIVVDWPSQGGMFSVWGDSVTVDWQIPNTWIAGALPASVAAGAVISPESNGGGLRATRCVYTGLVVGGAAAFSAPIPVPRMARAFRWHQQINLGAGNPQIPIAWYGTMDSGLAVPTFTTPATPFTSSPATWPSDEGIELPVDTRFLVFQNLGAAGQDLSMTVEFLLDLG